MELKPLFQAGSVSFEGVRAQKVLQVQESTHARTKNPGAGSVVNGGLCRDKMRAGLVAVLGDGAVPDRGVGKPEGLGEAR